MTTANTDLVTANENGLATLADIPDMPSTALDIPAEQRRYVYWVNGKPAMRAVGGVPYLGGWAIDAGKISADMLNPDIWDLTSMTTDTGQEFEVFTAPVVRAAIIGYRTSWIDQETPPRFHREFARGYRHYVEIACVLDGVADMAITLSAKGYNAQNLLSAYSKGANTIRSAIKANKPPFAFWIPLGGEVNDQGKPVITMVGSGDQKSGIVAIKPRFPAAVDYQWALDNRVPQPVLAYCISNLSMLPIWKEERFKARANETTGFDTGAENEPPPFE